MAPSGYWQRRNARAIGLGYRNYYDYRAHDNGRLPPSAPALRGDELERARGHGTAGDLAPLLRRRRVEMIGVVATVDNRGRPRIDCLVTLTNGKTREFRLNDKGIIRIRSIVDEMDPDAVLLVGSPSVVRQLTDTQKSREWVFKVKP
jgi:hypothetical protein